MADRSICVRTVAKTVSGSDYEIPIGAVIIHRPADHAWSYHDLNGSEPPPTGTRKQCVFIVTDIPIAVVERVKESIQEQIYIVTMEGADLLDNLGGGAYRVKGLPTFRTERLFPFAVNPGKLKVQFPAAAGLIDTMFDPSELHPAIPSVTWSKVKVCFDDLYTGTDADPDYLEGV